MASQSSLAGRSQGSPRTVHSRYSTAGATTLHQESPPASTTAPTMASSTSHTGSHPVNLFIHRGCSASQTGSLWAPYTGGHPTGCWRTSASPSAARGGAVHWMLWSGSTSTIVGLFCSSPLSGPSCAGGNRFAGATTAEAGVAAVAATGSCRRSRLARSHRQWGFAFSLFFRL